MILAAYFNIFYVGLYRTKAMRTLSVCGTGKKENDSVYPFSPRIAIRAVFSAERASPARYQTSSLFLIVSVSSFARSVSPFLKA